MDVIINLDRSALDNYLRKPSGGVWIWLERRGRDAVDGAKRQVHVRTGRLKNSIHMKHKSTAYGQELWIGSNTVPYAFAHHEGTRPHVIAPKNGAVLVLGRGRMVRGPVMHPGTKPNRFLSSQLWHFRY